MPVASRYGGSHVARGKGEQGKLRMCRSEMCVNHSHPFSWKGLEVAVGRRKEQENKKKFLFFSAGIELRALSVLSKSSSIEP